MRSKLSDATKKRLSRASFLATPNPTTSRLLKKAPNFVLGSKDSSTYPRGYASGSFSPAASLDDLFEQPDRSEKFADCSLYPQLAFQDLRQRRGFEHEANLIGRRI
jgi:hypothetical protein